MLELPALVALLEAWMLDKEEGKNWPEDPTLGGLSDHDLWERMIQNGDILAGMTFAEAVAQDPRRIEALIDQRVVWDFWNALDWLQGPRTEGLMEMAWRQGNAEIRQRLGQITAPALAARRSQMWDHYQKWLEVAKAMRRPGVPAERFWASVIANRRVIARAFRESAEIANRAAAVAGTDENGDAWRQMGALITNMHEQLAAAIAEIAGAGAGEEGGAPPIAGPGGGGGGGEEMRALPVPEEGVTIPEAAPEGEGGEGGGGEETFGWEPDWVLSQSLQGNRAPGTDLPQYHREGGRWP